MIFEKPGKVHTDETIDLALATAKEQGIKHIVIASHSGFTAEKLLGADFNVVCVTGVNGARQKGKNEMSKEMQKKLTDGGIRLVTASHVLSGAERGISTMVGGMYPVEVMAHTLRMFSQGVKVCVECAVMALDADAIPYGERIVAIGGTGTGADTAAILIPSHASSIFETRIHEVLCKPL